jgi:hypothetical protein
MKFLTRPSFVPFFTCFLALAEVAAANDSPSAFQPETVFSGTHSVSGAGGFLFGTTSLNGKSAFMASGRGGAIIDHFFEIGGSGTGMSIGNFQNQSNQRLSFGYGGFLVGVVPQSEKLVHARAHFLLGAGGASIHTMKLNQEMGDEIGSASYGVFEPSVGLELNLFRPGRAYVDISWRQVWGGATLAGVKASDLSSWGAGLGFRFGEF